MRKFSCLLDIFIVNDFKLVWRKHVQKSEYSVFSHPSKIDLNLNATDLIIGNGKTQEEALFDLVKKLEGQYLMVTPNNYIKFPQIVWIGGNKC